MINDEPRTRVRKCSGDPQQIHVSIGIGGSGHYSGATGPHLDALNEWQRFFKMEFHHQKYRGENCLGEKIKLVATIAPERTFKLAVKEFEPEKRMVWADGMVPMFTGVRTFMLEPKADGSTDFRMSELFRGLMLPMIAGSLPDFRPAFEQYAADLKREAEKAAS